MNHATTQPTAYRVETFCGTAEGWRAVSPAAVDAVTAARRLRLYRAVRGHARVYRLSAPVPTLLPTRRNATPWHQRRVRMPAVFGLFAVAVAAASVLAVRDAVQHATPSGVVSYANRAR